jgi:hypothetical protein
MDIKEIRQLDEELKKENFYTVGRAAYELVKKVINCLEEAEKRIKNLEKVITSIDAAINNNCETVEKEGV